VVTGLLVVLPAGVTDPRCGTLISPLVVATGLLTLLPAGVTDPRCATLISPLAVVADVLWRLTAAITVPRCGTLISPTTPPSATNTDWVTRYAARYPRTMLAPCGSCHGAVAAYPYIVQFENAQIVSTACAAAPLAVLDLPGFSAVTQ
jgi:hypothetical protein